MKGPFHGIAFHALDLQYVFLNMHDDLGENDLAYGQQVSEKYLRFAYGEAPWEPYRPGRKWGIFTENYTIETRTEDEDSSARNYSIWDAIEERGIMRLFIEACKFDQPA